MWVINCHACVFSYVCTVCTLGRVVCMSVCVLYICVFWMLGHDVDVTRAFIVVLVRKLSSITSTYFWFALHAVVALCVTESFSLNLIICNSWSMMALLFKIIVCCYLLAFIHSIISFSLDHRDLSKCMLGSVSHSPHYLTSFPCPASHRWRSATRSIPLRSVFSIEPCEACLFLSCHTPRSLPPDRMALELRAARKCPTYTTLRSTSV